MSLKDVREKVNKIDDEIVSLLTKRAEFAEKIGQVKRDKNLELHDVKRESEIIQRLMKHNKGPLKDENVKAIFTEVFSACLALQKHTKIVYLGPEATYTHIAAVDYFGKAFEYIPVHTINDVFLEVEKESADFGVVPIENSTEGMVNYTLDLFMESDLSIYAEIFMDIHHNLVSKVNNISEIKKVYTHSQAFAQCRRWLKDNVPQAKVIEVDSTALAALKVSKEDNAAAVASLVAADKYNLRILADRIQDTSQNTTRFFVVSKQMAKKTIKSKTSVLFSIKDKVGALYDMLTSFRKAGLNLTKIESRPTKKKAWEYVFFIDFLGHKDDVEVKKALKELEAECLFLKVLGSYAIK